MDFSIYYCVVCIILMCTYPRKTAGGIITTTESPHAYSENQSSPTTEDDIRIAITDDLDLVDPQFIPVFDHSTPLELYVEFTLLSLTNFDEISGELSIVASLNLTWQGSNLPSWDPSLLNGKQTYALSKDKIWTPQLLLLNPARSVLNLAAYSERVRITYNQTVIWHVISGISVQFKYDTLYSQITHLT